MAKTNFIDANPSQGILGTLVTASFLNSLGLHRHDGLDDDGHGPLDYAVAGGTANALTVALNPPLTALIPGMPIYIKASAANTGAATLNVDGLGAVAINKAAGAALDPGDIISGTVLSLVYDGTNWQASFPPRKASAAEVAAGLDDSKFVTPSSLSARIANRIGTTGPASCRNKLHNPLFAVAQRGSSGTVANGSVNWLFDRWGTVLTGLSGASMTVASSSMTLDGKPRKAMKVTSTVATASLAADGSAIPFRQCIEGQDLVDMLGDSATIRSYFRASVAGTYAAVLRVQNAAGSTVKTYTKKFTVTANAITEVLFTVPTDAANWICENSSAVGAWFMVGAIAGTTGQTSTADAWVTGGYIAPTGLTNWLATANATVELCLPQLERGTVASEFNCLDFDSEVSRCQRYLIVLGSGAVDSAVTGPGDVYAGATVCFPLTILKGMRATPTITILGGVAADFKVYAGSASVCPSAILLASNTTPLCVEIIADLPSQLGIGNACWMRTDTNKTARLALSAEI